MSRSKWKGFYIHSQFLKKKILLKKQINIWHKNSIVPKTLNNKKLIVYCGKTVKKIYVTTSKLNFKVGEFCFTRAKYFHKNKIKPTKLKSTKIKSKKK